MMFKKITRKIESNELSPWVMLQKWENLLFIHWPISPEVLANHLPEGLELDTYHGQAWISIVSFKISRVRLRHLPRIPYVRPMLQVNARTYVKRNGEKGVYFFSMDTNKLSAVLGAKMVTAPFYHADMRMKKITDTYHIYSSRKGKVPAKFKASYCPKNEFFQPEKQGLDYWLLERYIMWTYKSGHLYRGDIQHESWSVKHAKINIKHQSLFPFLPENVTKEKPLVHYARSKVALNWMIKKIE
ncbi:YqjF family protein [Oceanobacillus sp. J11TS1]|uniref:YqjF family protein n=1 Tax=Oceanobacillus sp. J11TS1 TaxID=2807191 RepID=UPI001B07F180|nr:DUF2071 domain-containing protein [Oceanobacillus sp. J11TS1]GIO24880.1 hypothetical protein J11TS1_34610 [Oceanobacillus sp. J11TS1]